MKPTICGAHRKELLRFLLLKTAAVRCGVKPGEFLRLRHCYRALNAEGFQFCLYRKDILEILQLKYLELRNEGEDSLVLFYDETAMTAALARPENRAVLTQYGYPEPIGTTAALTALKERFARESLPHEIGVFIGYPAKDVLGFIGNLPRTPVHRGDWAVFGDAGESVRRMTLYRQAEQAARSVLDACEDLQTFFDRIANLNLTQRNLVNG